MSQPLLPPPPRKTVTQTDGNLLPPPPQKKTLNQGGSGAKIGADASDSNPQSILGDLATQAGNAVTQQHESILEQGKLASQNKQQSYEAKLQPIASLGAQAAAVVPEDYNTKVLKIRPVGRNNGDGTTSTVLMEQSDNIAYPTIFPKDPNSPTENPDDWIELHGNEAIAEAKKRNEVFEFKTPEEALEFANGSWKNKPKEYQQGYAFGSTQVGGGSDAGTSRANIQDELTRRITDPVHAFNQQYLKLEQDAGAFDGDVVKTSKALINQYKDNLTPEQKRLVEVKDEQTQLGALGSKFDEMVSKSKYKNLLSNVNFDDTKLALTQEEKSIKDGMNQGYENQQAAIRKKLSEGGEIFSPSGTNIVQWRPYSQEEKDDMAIQYSQIESLKSDLYKTDKEKVESAYEAVAPDIVKLEQQGIIPKDASDYDKMVIYGATLMKEQQELQEEWNKRMNDPMSNLKLGAAMVGRTMGFDNEFLDRKTDIDHKVEMLLPIILTNRLEAGEFNNLPKIRQSVIEGFAGVPAKTEAAKAGALMEGMQTVGATTTAPEQTQVIQEQLTPTLGEQLGETMANFAGQLPKFALASMATEGLATAAGINEMIAVFKNGNKAQKLLGALLESSKEGVTMSLATGDPKMFTVGLGFGAAGKVANAMNLNKLTTMLAKPAGGIVAADALTYVQKAIQSKSFVEPLKEMGYMDKEGNWTLSEKAREGFVNYMALLTFSAGDLIKKGADPVKMQEDMQSLEAELRTKGDTEMADAVLGKIDELLEASKTETPVETTSATANENNTPIVQGEDINISEPKIEENATVIRENQERIRQQGEVNKGGEKDSGNDLQQNQEQPPVNGETEQQGASIGQGGKGGGESVQEKIGGKALISEGLEDLGKALGVIKSAQGEKSPEVSKALAKIARGMLDEGIATASDVFEKVKAYVKEKFGHDVGDEYREDIQPRYEDAEQTKMANAINDAYIEGKFGGDALDEMVGKLKGTDLEKNYEKLRARLKNGSIDVEKIRKSVIKKQSGSADEQMVLLYDLAQLKGKEEALRRDINSETDANKKLDLQRDLLKVQDDILDNALANKHIGRDWHNIGKARQVWVDKSANLSDMMEQYKASKGVSDLTAEQQQKVREAYNRIKDLELKIQELKNSEQKSRQEAEEAKTKNEALLKIIEDGKVARKADRHLKATDAINKSKARIEQSKNKLRQLRGTLSAGVNPEVALEIGKIAKEKVYQGVVKLDEVVRNVLDEIRDIFPEFTEDDIKRHLSYTKESKPREEGSKILSVLKKTLQTKYRTEAKDFKAKERKVYEKSDQLKAAEKEYALARFEWDRERRMDLMANRGISEKILDTILQWQRFSVLSYPSTILKLASVVAHGIGLKPLMEGYKALSYAITPRGITEKQSLWGKPRWSALGKYYSAFIRNFALQNLKEHFKGIDAKEAMYGKPHIYEEGVGRGLLEMPGRSHGYIKSFIKNAEFAYAHETLLKNYIDKANKIQQKLREADLSADERTALENEYKQYDVTSDDVMEKINKLSLEHGKWSILMNDNNVTNNIRSFMNSTGMAGKFVQSELPIVKIPLNYIGRAFAIKYGLITSLLGKRDFLSKGMPKEAPGLIELAIRGTKNLTPEQADILGRSLTQGTIGASFFALGYVLSNQIKHNDDGSYDIAGQHIDKKFIHNPFFESIFSGAITRQSMKNDKSAKEFLNQFISSDIETVKQSPFASMLAYGFTGKAIEALFDRSGDHDKIRNKIAVATTKKITDMAVPGFVKELAKATSDDKEGYYRVNQTPQDVIYNALPWYREKVDEKKIPVHPAEKDSKGKKTIHK